MKKRYWEPEDPPGIDALKDWVSREVVVALGQLMDEGDVWLEVRKGRLKLKFVSFERPTKDGQPEQLWSKSFDLLDIVKDFASDYKEARTLSEAQRQDLEMRAAAFDALAAAFRKIAGVPKSSK